MKLVLGTLTVLLGLLLPVSAYAADDYDDAAPDDSTYYEITYTQCAFRYSNSSYNENEIECLCNEVAEHAVKWRSRSGTGQIPALPDSAEARCLDRR